MRLKKILLWKKNRVNTMDIGRLHNEAMDEIFQTLKKETVPLKHSNIDAVIKKGFKSFFDKENSLNKENKL